MLQLLRHDLSRGIGRARERRLASSRMAAGTWGGLTIKITEDVRKYAAEQAISEKEALQRGMAEKSKEFVEAGAEVCQPA